MTKERIQQIIDNNIPCEKYKGYNVHNPECGICKVEHLVIQSMKQAVNEAIQETIENVLWKTELTDKNRLQQIADQLKVK